MCIRDRCLSARMPGISRNCWISGCNRRAASRCHCRLSLKIWSLYQISELLYYVWTLSDDRKEKMRTTPSSSSFFYSFYKKFHRYYYLWNLTTPRVGFEPTTLRLTAECSTTELSRNTIKLSQLLSLSKWRIRDSNSWPPACKAGALPTELIPRSSCSVITDSY